MRGILLRLALTGLLILWLGRAGLAADHLISAGETRTTPVTLDVDGDSLTIENGGTLSIAAGDPAVFAMADDFSIINGGTIEYLDFDAAIFVWVSEGGIIRNEATGEITSGNLGINALVSTFALANSGAIEGVRGIELSSSIVTSFVSTGSIIGSEEGIHQHGSELTGSNSGTISGGETGFSVHESSTLDFANSGSIEGTSLYGVRVYDNTASGTTVARLANSGLIRGGDAAISIQDAELDLVNTGRIEGGTFGVFQTGTGGLTLSNAGLVSGSSHALFLDGSGNLVTLLPGSVLDGAIYFAADNSLIIGNGLNALVTFDPASALPAALDTNGMPSVIDAANNQVAVVDPTGFAMADEMLTDLADSVLDTLARGGHRGEEDLSASLPSGETVAAASRRFASRTSLWAEVFGRWREQDQGGAVWSSDHRLSGAVAGLGGELSEGLSGGVFLGAATGELSVDDEAQDIESQSLYGGFHLARDSGPGVLTAALLLGWQQNDSIRRIASNAAVSGVEMAEATYDGVFVVPEVAYERRTGAFVSSLSARYAALFLDDFEEHGSSADLSVDSRSIHLAGADLRLSLPSNVPLPQGALLLEPQVGLKGRLLLGDGAISAQLLGVSIDDHHVDQEEAVVSLYAAAAAAFRSEDGRMALRFTGDAAVATDGSVVLSAGLGGDLAF
jgi:Autotransporter beta-domain